MVTIIKKGTSIQEIRKQIKKAYSRKNRQSIMQFAGKLPADLDALEYQRSIRDEWR